MSAPLTRLFLFGTLRWPDLLAEVAGMRVAVTAATLEGWRVERAAAGDWPVLVPGGAAMGVVTAPLNAGARARLDFYEAVFGYGVKAVEVDAGGDAVAAEVYREAGGPGGAGEPWDLGAWRARHGERTLLAATEVMRAHGREAPADVAARRVAIHARAQGIVAGRAYLRPVTVGGGMDADGIAVADVTYPYDGFQRVEEWRLDHPRFDGGRSGTIERMITQVADAATVLPYDAARDRVLVVEQIRIGALAKGDRRPWMLEPVAGLIDAGETPEGTALRELSEEAGIVAAPDALRLVARYYPSPGGLAQVLHSYVALCDLPDGAGGLHGLAAEGEDIRAHLLPLDDLLAMIETGEAANAPLIVSAQWLALRRARLKP